ncbi:MAG: NUDIX hydrolase [Nocardioides sp.]|nr:NUDIX hydrolase [Nocardioides sp.]
MHRFSSVVLVDPRGWLLLQERDEHPVIDPECWGFPGGHVEDGEEHEAAAYRELAEESGVRLPPGTLVEHGEVEVFHEAYDTLDRVRLYAAATDLTDDAVVVGEGRRIVFVDPATALGLPLTRGAAAALPGFVGSPLHRTLTETARRTSAGSQEAAR